MIRAEFHRRNGAFLRLQVEGHAGYADPGEDIVCASVTSAVQMAANGITEVLRTPAEVRVEDNRITVVLPGSAPEAATQFLQALWLHLELLAQEYPEHIGTTVTEV